MKLFIAILSLVISIPATSFAAITPTRTTPVYARYCNYGSCQSAKIYHYTPTPYVPAVSPNLARPRYVNEGWTLINYPVNPQPIYFFKNGMWFTNPILLQPGYELEEGIKYPFVYSNNTYTQPAYRYYW